MSDKATPRPWHIVPETLGSIRAANDVDVAQAQQTGPVRSAADNEERLANAALIVRAVNAHDGLVEAAKQILRVHDEGGFIDGRVINDLRAALRAAGVEP